MNSNIDEMLFIASRAVSYSVVLPFNSLEIGDFG